MKSTITIHATVNADIKKAWDHYTDPAHIKKWNFADPSWHCPSASNDLRVGGKYSARMEAKDGSFGFDFEATYIEIVDGKKFIYIIPDGRQVTVDFSSNEGKTDVTVTFDAEEQNSIERQRNGWQSILDNYKNYTEAS